MNETSGTRKIRLEFKISSVTDIVEGIPALRWSELWGIYLAPTEVFYLTDDQLRLAFPRRPPKEVCAFSFQLDRLHFQMLDSTRASEMNSERKSDGICGPGDRILIAESVLIEVVKAPPLAIEPLPPSIFPPLSYEKAVRDDPSPEPESFVEEAASSFEAGLAQAFKFLEKAIRVSDEDTEGKKSEPLPPPVFIDHRPIEIEEPTSPETRRPRPRLPEEKPVLLEGNSPSDDFMRVPYRSRAIVRYRSKEEWRRARRRRTRKYRVLPAALLFGLACVLVYRYGFGFFAH